MKEITVYECEYCKKLFKTPNRHVCKYNPKFKNCHSCKHCLGFEREDFIGGINVGVGYIPTDQLYPICEKSSDKYAEHGAQDLSIMCYDLDCDDYEWCGGRWVDYQNNKN